MPDDLVAPDRAAARARARARLAAADGRRRRGRRRDRHARRAGRRGRHRLRRSRPSTRTSRSSCGRGITLRQHDEQRDARRGRRAREVRRARRPGARPPDADRRRRRQRAGRAEGRAEDRGEVARAVRHARRQSSRTRARFPASSARTCARRSTGCRRASACSPSRPIATLPVTPADLALGAPRRGSSSRRSTSASSSRAGCATFDDGARRSPDVAGRDRRSRVAPATRGRSLRRRSARQRSRRDTPAARAAPLRDRARRGDARALAGARSSARSSSCFDTETTSLDPMQAKIVGLSFAIEPGRACYIPLAHRYPGAPDQLDRSTRRSRASRRGSPIRAKKKLGQNVKYDQHVLANHGLTLARRRARHAARVVRARGAPAARHGQPRVAASRREDDHLRRGRRQGREADRLRPGEHRATRPRTRPRTPTSRCSCTALSIRASRPIAKLDHVYTAIEMPVREVLFRDGAQRRACSTRRCSPRRAASSASKVMALEQQAYRARRAAVQPRRRRSSWARSCSSKMKLPAVRKTATGQPSTDEDVLTELAADYPLPKVLLEHRALSKLKSTYTDKLPQMVNRAHRPRAHDVQPGDGGDRTARVERSQPAEHSGAHRRRPAHPRGVHRAARARDRLRRLFADRAADHGAPVGRSGAA